MRLPVCLFLLLIGFGVGAEPADTVFRHGEIYTVNDVQPWVQAVAVKDKRIVFAGDDRVVEKYIGNETEVIDLQGKMAMPGIHDAHIHMMSGRQGCSIPPGPIEGRFAEALEDCAAELEEGEWLVARPYLSEQFPDGIPHRKYLDKIFPDRPVYLREVTAHNALANTRALEIAGIDASTEVTSGELARDEDGRLTGELVESQMALITRFIPPPSLKQRVEALRTAVRTGNRYGITSVQEAGATREYLTALKQLEEDGDLSLHVTAHIVWDTRQRYSEEQIAEMKALIDNRAKFQSDHIDPNNIKMHVDGTPTAPYFTAAALDPETGEPEWEDILIPPALLNKYVTRFDAMGMKVKIHASGSGGAHVAIDAFEHARKANPTSDIWLDLAHTNLVSEADMNRMRGLNIVGEMSPSLWHIYGKTLGDPPRKAWQFRTLSNKGVLLTIGTDWGVPKTPNLFPALEGLLLFGDESLDLVSALRAMTWHGAVAIGREEDMGMLKPGKLANLIVLDRNLFEVDTEEIGDTVVMMTVFEGTIVHDKL